MQDPADNTFGEICALIVYIRYVTLPIRETREHEHISVHGGLPSFIGGTYPPDERKEAASLAFPFSILRLVHVSRSVNGLAADCLHFKI